MVGKWPPGYAACCCGCIGADDIGLAGWYAIGTPCDAGGTWLEWDKCCPGCEKCGICPGMPMLATGIGWPTGRNCCAAGGMNWGGCWEGTTGLNCNWNVKCNIKNIAYNSGGDICVKKQKSLKFQFTCIGIGGPRFCGWVLEPIMGGLGGCS